MQASERISNALLINRKITHNPVVIQSMPKVREEATGGMIRGPGTGTSDSIPAMLSNGEFVVNAKATAQNRELLERINSGKVAKFAEGGIVKKKLDAHLDESFLKLQNTEYFEITGLDRTIIENPVGARIEFGSPSRGISAEVLTPSIHGGIPESLADILQRYAIGLHEFGHGFDYNDLFKYVKNFILQRKDLFEKAIKSLENNEDPRSKYLPRDVNGTAAAYADSLFTDNYISIFEDSPFAFLRDLRPISGEKNNPILAAEYRATLWALKNKIPETSFEDVAVALREGLYSYAEQIPGQSYHVREETSPLYKEIKGFLGGSKASIFNDNLKGFQEERSKVFENNRRNKAANKYATGGFIRGPGTGKSDDIPAMLSNGEFVVNAKASRENADILRKINSGQSVRYFGGGGETLEPFPQYFPQFTPPPSLLEKATISIVDFSKEFSKADDKVAFFIAQFKKFFEWMSKSISETAPGFKDPKLSSVDEAMGKTRKTLQESDDGYKYVADELANLKVGNIKSEDLKKLGWGGTDKLAALIDDIKTANENANTTKRPWVREQNLEVAKNSETALVRLLREAKLTPKVESNFGNAAQDESKYTGRYVSDQLNVINAAFPRLSLTLKEFYESTDDFRESLFKSANEIDIKSRALDATKIGEEGSETPATVAVDREKLEKERIEAEKKALAAVAAKRTPFENYKAFFEKYSINVNDALFNALSSSDKFKLNNLQGEMDDLNKTIQAPGDTVTPAARAEAQKAFTFKMLEIDKVLVNGLKTVSGKFGVVSSQFQKIGVSISDKMFETLSNQQQDILLNLSKGILDLSPLLDSENEAVRAAATRIRDDLVKNFSQSLSEKAGEAGKTFANNQEYSFNNALNTLLRGQSDEGKSVWKTFTDRLVDDFTNNVISTFTDGVSNAILGSGSKIGGLMEKLGGNQFKLGNILGGGKRGETPATPLYVEDVTKRIDDVKQKLLDSAKYDVSDTGITDVGLTEPVNLLSEEATLLDVPENAFKDIGVNAAIPENIFDSLEVPFDKLGDLTAGLGESVLEGASSLATTDFSSIFAVIGKAFSDGLSAVTKFFGYAEGGFVSGSGSAKSDSIPAMLSNGEFVVNAKATKRFGPLLETINSGTFKKFSEGGLVTPVIVSNRKEAPTVSSQQVINLNITGDISRQTRSEIYAMIPQIAGGVNSHNKEKGYKS
jgi:hypothetical protein